MTYLRGGVLAGIGLLIVVGCLFWQPISTDARSVPASPTQAATPEVLFVHPGPRGLPELPQPTASPSAMLSPKEVSTAPVAPPVAQQPPAPSFGVPYAVSIPQIGVVEDAVTPEGLTFGAKCGDNASGGCILPAGQRLVWNSTTVLPGQPGRAVIAGHDYAEGARTKFWNLYKVPVGSSITLRVRNTAGETGTLTLKVTASKAEPKDEVQNDPAVQDSHGTTAKVVVFITCNPARGLYRDNTGLHAYDNQVVTTEVISAS